ncbi:MAG: hypothetical protein LBL39_06785 [Planctomycetaceae bacterium]|nr:hypothetical protein [Planctomycetaceae bacterium]
MNKWSRLNNAIPTDQKVESFFRVYSEYTVHTAILGMLRWSVQNGLAILIHCSFRVEKKTCNPTAFTLTSRERLQFT